MVFLESLLAKTMTIQMMEMTTNECQDLVSYSSTRSEILSETSLFQMLQTGTFLKTKKTMVV